MDATTRLGYSVNDSVVVFAIFILAALALFGGDSLTDFAVALLAGILVGTWSSVFTATPVALLLDRSD